MRGTARKQLGLLNAMGIPAVELINLNLIQGKDISKG